MVIPCCCFTLRQPRRVLVSNTRFAQNLTAPIQHHGFLVAIVDLAAKGTAGELRSHCARPHAC